MMKMNKWTMALAAAGVVSLSSVAQAQEAVAAAATDGDSFGLSGYVSSSYTMASNRSGSTFRGTDANSDKFSLDVVSLTLGEAKGEGEWASGYNLTMWIGPAASDINTSSTSDSGNTVELMEANIDLTVPVGSGLNLTVGQIGTVVGYENYNYGLDDEGEIENAFHNRSWAFAAEPTHHTGILAEYQVNDQIGVGVGVINDSQNNVTNSSANSNKSSSTGYLLKAEYAKGFMADEGFSVSLGAVLDTGTNSAKRDTYYYEVGLPVQGMLPSLTADVAATLVDDDNNNDTEIYQVYLGYSVGEKTTINARYEFGDDDITAGKSDIKSYAIGVTHELWTNVTSRVEYMTSDWEGASDDEEALTISLIYNF